MASKTRASSSKTSKTKKAKTPASPFGVAYENQEEVPLVRKCGTMQVHFRLLEQDPNQRLLLGDLERETSRRMLAGPAARVGVTTIPVVVHVVYSNAQQNISISQIKSQISALNRDYRAKNTDKAKAPAVWRGLATDTNVQFALATKDPNGKKTNGITRTQTTVAVFSDDDAVKSSAHGGADAWPADRYLNLWVCALGGGLLGYAQFPGGQPATDGVVINYRAFGTKGTASAPFNLGRTATHEVGHWLNLHHIWGDTSDCSGSDFVSDTPKAQHPNFGKPNFPHISCNNGPNGDMFMNYMDYVDDDTMVMFTAQQVVRMSATLDGPRGSIGT
jgi:Pregnancy-associated plasma protein-A